MAEPVTAEEKKEKKEGEEKEEEKATAETSPSAANLYDFFRMIQLMSRNENPPTRAGQALPLKRMCEHKSLSFQKQSMIIYILYIYIYIIYIYCKYTLKIFGGWQYVLDLDMTKIGNEKYLRIT